MLQEFLILLFGLSGVVCIALTQLVSRVPNSDVRQGLFGLLFLSGLWAVSELGLLLFSSARAMRITYIFGLIVGLPTVGAWLYFCSAYTGHDYHRRPVFRRAAVGLYLFIVLVKITNPYHEQYFTSTIASDPFPHLAIRLMPAHWVVAGLSYALTAIGFYMLYELFSESNLDTKRLSILIVLTGLPAALDILSYTGNIVFTMNYEPIGVAVFGTGALYVIDEQFIALPAFWRQDVLEALDDPVLVFGRDGEIRDYNVATLDYFPELEQTKGQSLDNVYPVLAADLTDGDNLVEIDIRSGTRYFAVERETLTIESKEFGRVVILSDVTTIEQQRRELQLQNDQFGDLAVIITHELRNLLTVIRGHMDMSASQLADNVETPLRESYERGITAAERMEQVTTDLAKLTQYSQASQNRTQCDMQAVITKGWQDAETDGMSLSINTSRSVYGQKIHLIDLFSNVFNFTQALDASATSVSVEEDRIVITSDGTPLSDDDIEAAFTYGEAVPSPETGMLLPMVRAIVRAHSWTIDIIQDDNAVSLCISTK